MLEKQNDLLKQLKGMEPMMQQANDMLNTISSGPLNSVLGGILGTKKKIDANK